jgi:hypothetical protein
MTEENVQQAPSPESLASAFSSYTTDLLGVKNEQEEGVQTTQEIKPEENKAEPLKTEPQIQAEPLKVEPEKTEPIAPQDWFDVSKVNERFGTEFKTEDEVKEAIRSLTENQEYLEKKDYYSEIEKVVADMQEQLNPLKMFKTKENYEKVMIASSLSEVMPEPIAQTVVTTDFTKVDNLEAIYLEAIARDPNLLAYTTESDIKKGLLEISGVDVSDPEFDIAKYQEAIKSNPRALIDLSAKATQAKNFFKGVLDEARKTVPEIKDWKQEIEQRAKERVELTQKRTSEWTAKAKELADQFNEFTIIEKDATGKDVVDFTFPVPKEFKDGLANYLLEYAVSNGFDVTPERVAALKTEIQDAFEDKYRDKIRKAYREDGVSKAKEEVDNKVFNNKPISTQEAPPEHAQTYQDEVAAQRKLFGLAT